MKFVNVCEEKWNFRSKIRQQNKLNEFNRIRLIEFFDIFPKVKIR